MKIKPSALCFVLATGCIELSVSDEKAIKKFEESITTPIFADTVVGDRSIHYVHTNQGQKTLIVFVHGSPGTWSAFLDFFKADSLLSEMDFLAIDRPGFGGSGKGLAEPSMEKQAYYLRGVTKKFNHQIKILVGHSLGGPVIARMAMDYPEDYSALLFVAASIDPEMEKDEWYRNVINTKVGGFFTPEDFVVSNDEILPLKKELERMLPMWSEIQIPSIVIQGTSDSLVPKENTDFAKRMLPDSLLEIRLLDGVNHFIPWSHPEEIIGAIRDLTPQ